jgi:hypothetical protein
MHFKIYSIILTIKAKFREASLFAETIKVNCLPDELKKKIRSK